MAIFDTFDALLTVTRDDGVVRACELAIEVEIVAGGATAALAATEANLAYAQALYALTHDATLAGLCIDLAEGNSPEGGGASHGVEAEINRDTATGPIAGCRLHLTAVYEERAGSPSKREAILEAVNLALGASSPSSTPPVRELVLVGLLAAASGVEPTDRNTDRPDAPETLACHFFDGDQEVEHGEGYSRYYLSFALELYAPDSNEAALATRATAMLAGMRAVDRLGGLLLDTPTLDLDPQLLRDAFTVPALGIRLEGRAIFDTMPNDPTALFT